MTTTLCQVIARHEASRVARPHQTTHHHTDDSVGMLVAQYLRNPDLYNVEMDSELGTFVIRVLNAPVGTTYHNNPICHEGTRQESGLWAVSSCYVPTARSMYA